MHNIYAGCHMLFSRFTAIPCLSLQAVKHISVPKRNSTSSIKNRNSSCPDILFCKKETATIAIINATIINDSMYDIIFFTIKICLLLLILNMLQICESHALYCLKDNMYITLVFLHLPVDIRHLCLIGQLFLFHKFHM